MFNWLTQLPRQHGVYVAAAPTPAHAAFAQAYLRVRQREGRVYDDATLRHLPAISSQHPLAKEWHARAESAERLVRHLRHKIAAATSLRLLDIGCGNGWLSHTLAQSLPNSVVVGLDINLPELNQAARVFAAAPNLAFVYGESNNLLPVARFDVIVVASAAQYFADLPAQVRVWRNLLASHGEIHLLDSPFYPKSQLASTQAATRRYYQSHDAPELAVHYHAHDLTHWLQFQPRLMYDPSALKNRARRRLGLRGAASPFQWWCLHV